MTQKPKPKYPNNPKTKTWQSWYNNYKDSSYAEVCRRELPHPHFTSEALILN